MLFNPILCTGCGRFISYFFWWGFVWVHLRDSVPWLLPLTTQSPLLHLSPSHARHGSSHRWPPPRPVHHQGERHQREQGEPRQRHRTCHRVQEVPQTYTGETGGEDSKGKLMVYLHFYNSIHSTVTSTITDLRRCSSLMNWILQLYLIQYVIMV